MQERAHRYSKLQRWIGFLCATVAAIVVVASGCVQLIHLF
jgi:hypothetical protein